MRGAARRTSRRATRRVALVQLTLRPMELDIVVAMKAFLGRRVRLHVARSKHVVGTAATEAAAEIRGKVGNGSSRGGILVIGLNRRAGRGLGRRATLHCCFGGRCIGRRFETVAIGAVGAVGAVVVRCKLLKHEAHVAFVILNCTPTLDGKRL